MLSYTHSANMVGEVGIFLYESDCVRKKKAFLLTKQILDVIQVNYVLGALPMPRTVLYEPMPYFPKLVGGGR